MNLYVLAELKNELNTETITIILSPYVVFYLEFAFRFSCVYNTSRFDEKDLEYLQPDRNEINCKKHGLLIPLISIPVDKTVDLSIAL